MILKPKEIDCKALFNLDINFPVMGFQTPQENTPKRDENFYFDPIITTSILAGFSANLRIMISGLHGTGKSSHIEQVCARLNWGCLRINLDSHIQRSDLLGKDVLTIDENANQVTRFEQGLLPLAMQSPTALIFDEYDAGKPDIMFVIQRLLEENGQFTLLDQNKIITPHQHFRLFATANTNGFGDNTGLYNGSQILNQAQLDRWNILAKLKFMPSDHEINVIIDKNPQIKTKKDKDFIVKIVEFANLTREAFNNNSLSLFCSTRTLISWAKIYTLMNKDMQLSFQLSFLNRCDNEEFPLINELWQRVFNTELQDISS